MDEVTNMPTRSLLNQLSIKLSLFAESLFAESLFAESSSRLRFHSMAATLAIALLAPQVTSAFAQSNKTQAQSPQRASEKAGSASDVARGKYIVEGIARCGQCHTPRDSQGHPDRRHWLQGGPVPFMPSEPDADWPVRVPRIGGTPPADDADMVKLLTTGIWTTGAHLRAPMPEFRMERSDAEAVVAYLKSLPSQP
jgi:mono/diheme cytochrome c family protein